MPFEHVNRAESQRLECEEETDKIGANYSPKEDRLAHEIDCLVTAHKLKGPYFYVISLQFSAYESLDVFFSNLGILVSVCMDWNLCAP
jgi:hypothetical protein